MQCWPGSAVWVLVAQRIYTCLHIRFLQHAFQDVGSVSCCCFIRFFAWCRKNSLCHARSCSHVQMKRSRPCKKRSRLGFACNAFGWWWNVFWTNESVNWCFYCHVSISNRHVLQPPQTNAVAPTNFSATAGIAWLSITAVAVGRSVSTVPTKETAVSWWSLWQWWWWWW